MIVKIQVRDSAGAFRYRDANVGEFAESALKTIIEDGGQGNSQHELYPDGWWWLRQWLCKAILARMDRCCHSDHAEADRWYRRYQEIRGIE